MATKLKEKKPATAKRQQRAARELRTKPVKATGSRPRRDPVGGFESKLGQHLERLMIAAGMTTAEFAKKIGRSDDVVTMYFTGHRTPRTKDLPNLAKVLKVSLTDILPK